MIRWTVDTTDIIFYYDFTPFPGFIFIDIGDWCIESTCQTDYILTIL